MKVIGHDNERIEGHARTDLRRGDPEIMNDLANRTQLDAVLDNLPEQRCSIVDAESDQVASVSGIVMPGKADRMSPTTRNSGRHGSWPGEDS
jgi:hypothetical protein